MKKLLAIALITVIVLLTITTGCAQKTEVEAPEVIAEGARSGGSIILAGESEPGNLNPVIWATTSDTNVTHLMYDCLVIPDRELKMIGKLAKDWDISEDGRTYTFHLNENIKWHDGIPFTAEDVEFTFTMIANPEYDMGATSRVLGIVGAEAYRSGDADNIEGIKVIDDLTISFTTIEPSAPFLASLYIGVIPKHILKNVPLPEWAEHTTNRAPVGTGPFKFVEWKSGQYISVEANMDYFMGAPKLDKIIYRFGDQNTMLSAFINKEVDIAPLPISEYDSVKDLTFSEVKLQDQLTVYYIGFNLRNDFFKNEKIRIAMAYATNKELIVASVLGKFGRVEDDVFPSSHWSHNPNITKYSYNPEKAKELIGSMGYSLNKDGFFEKDGKELGLTLEVPTGKKEREQTAVLLKQDWEAVGIKTELRFLDFPTLVTKLLPKTKDGKQRPVSKDDFDAYILGYGVEADPDEYSPYFNSALMPPNGYNFCGYDTTTMDTLLENQKGEINIEKRQQIFWEIGEEICAGQSWLPIYGINVLFATNNKMVDFEPDFRGVSFNARLWSVK
jgi:peptide/nickel transport system substrate-binding protein